MLRFPQVTAAPQYKGRIEFDGPSKLLFRKLIHSEIL